MALLDQTSTLTPVREKVEAGERLGVEDGLAVLESDDLLELGELQISRGGCAAARTRSISCRTST